MLLIKYILFILILTIKSRVYENIYTIQKNIISNISEISFSFAINGTNNYMYKFETKKIFFKNEKDKKDTTNNTIYLYNSSIIILFTLSISEINTNVFIRTNDKIIFKKEILGKINFDFIEYFQASKDFSFEMSYKLKNITDNVFIDFNYLKKIEMFNYLIYEEKNIKYDNNTFYEYLKSIILNNTINKMNKNLVYYPESDALYFFNNLYNYIEHQTFYVFVPCGDFIYFHKATINKFMYDDLIKNNGNITFLNAKYNISYIYFYDDYERNFDDNEGKEILELDYFGIDQDFKPFYSKITSPYSIQECLLEAFIYIFNKANNSTNN